jgi:aspartyl-tRNA(Asn)/glutamyl-tRNA(Gln) amidotransferase subunit C
MHLSPDDIRHIAKLARLELSDAEIERFPMQLSSILDYVSQLQKVDTAGVEATAHVTGLESVLRPDEPRAPLCSPDALLACSPLPIVERQVQTQAAH